MRRATRAFDATRTSTRISRLVCQPPPQELSVVSVSARWRTVDRPSVRPLPHAATTRQGYRRILTGRRPATRHRPQGPLLSAPASAARTRRIANLLGRSGTGGVRLHDRGRRSRLHHFKRGVCLCRQGRLQEVRLHSALRHCKDGVLYREASSCPTLTSAGTRRNPAVGKCESSANACRIRSARMSAKLVASTKLKSLSRYPR